LSNPVSRETPGQLARVAELMSSFPSDWILCGGWAVDAWLGRITREHGDLDITVFEDAEQALFKHLADWQMVPHDGELADSDTNAQWTGRKLAMPAHLHCRGPEDSGDIPQTGALLAEQGWNLEIVINAREHGEWVLSDEPRVTIPLDRCAAKSSWGLPTALPEVPLFYKATAYKGTHNYLRRRDHLDFERLLPTLTPDQRGWLRESIAVVDSDHPWLGLLLI
jgi:hypothetical protein